MRFHFLKRWRLAPDDVLRDPSYRRLFASVGLSTLGGQVTLLALPLTAATLLNASPQQMGWLTAAEVLPFVLFSLPAGVWLDRSHKLPLYRAGEALVALSVASVAVAWWWGWLSMGWLLVVAFLVGSVTTVAGSAAQIVLAQVVPREKLVQAHARNALANASAEVAGPGAAGVLIQLLGAPLALLVDALLLLLAVGVLAGVKVKENLARSARRGFVVELREGAGFVRRQPLLRTLALAIGAWQFAYHAAQVVQVLHAARNLALSPQAIGLAFVAVGAGTILASVRGDAWSQRHGPGPTLISAMALSGLGWLLPVLWPAGRAGVVALVGCLFLYGLSAVLLMINFFALRQAVTPAPLLGRMTATMRWLVLLPAVPGALTGGWLAERFGLAATFAMAAGVSLASALLAWRLPLMRRLKALPAPAAEAAGGPAAETQVGAEVGPPGAPADGPARRAAAASVNRAANGPAAAPTRGEAVASAGDTAQSPAGPSPAESPAAGPAAAGDDAAEATCSR